MIIVATLKDINEGIGKAFENFARKANLKVNDKTTFRCTKIEVSKEIDDYFWKYYTDKCKEENPELSNEEIKTQIEIIMLNYGAKRNESLNP